MITEKRGRQRTNLASDGEDEALAELLAVGDAVDEGDEGVDALSLDLVLHADDRRLRTLRVGDQRRLHLRRADPVPAARRREEETEAPPIKPTPYHNWLTPIFFLCNQNEGSGVGT